MRRWREEAGKGSRAGAQHSTHGDNSKNLRKDSPSARTSAPSGNQSGRGGSFLDSSSSLSSSSTAGGFCSSSVGGWNSDMMLCLDLQHEPEHSRSRLCENLIFILKNKESNIEDHHWIPSVDGSIQRRVL
jgi:hypothetical protein